MNRIPCFHEASSVAGSPYLVMCLRSSYLTPQVSKTLRETSVDPQRPQGIHGGKHQPRVRRLPTPDTGYS